MTIPAGNVIRWAAAALLAVAASGPALAASAAPSVFQPSRITFKAEYRGITAGTITISLLDAGQGNYIYESRANAGGLARLIVHHEIREASTFTLENNQIRPLAYVLDRANHVPRERQFAGRSFKGYDIPYQGHNIWGATAVMLMSLGRLLEQS